MRKLKHENWIALVSKIHNNKYDYSRVNYVGCHIPVDIICPIHGLFKQTPQNHKKTNCPKCSTLIAIETKAKRKYIKRTKGLAYYISKAQLTHKGRKYDYSKISNDVKSSDKVSIICEYHGEFKQRLGDHVRGQGCPKCGAISRRLHPNNIKLGNEYYINKAIQVHGNIYDYTHIPKHCGTKDNVIIVCKIHGSFVQSMDKHINGKTGCPECCSISRATYTKSNGEQEIYDFILTLGYPLIENDRTLIAPLELDIYLPQQRLAIEYNGLYWHGENKGKDRNYHKNKLIKCRDKGIRLLQIFEDEWVYKREIVENKIKYIVQSPLSKVYARQCKVVNVDHRTKVDFF